MSPQLENSDTAVPEITKQVHYGKRPLELVAFNSQLELIEKTLAAAPKTNTNPNSFASSSTGNVSLNYYPRYGGNNYQQSYYQNSANNASTNSHHNPNLNKYTLAAVAAAAAVQQQQHQSYLFQQHIAKQSPSYQQNQKQGQGYQSSPYQQPLQQIQQQKLQGSMYQKKPQLFGPHDGSDMSASSSVLSETRPPAQASSSVNPNSMSAPIDFKSNYLLFNESSQSLLSPKLSATGPSQQKQSAPLHFKLFDSIGSDANNIMNSPIMLPPSSSPNKNSPPNLFLSTTGSSLNSGPSTGSSLSNSGTLPNNSSLLSTVLPSNSTNTNTNTSSIWGLNNQSSLSAGHTGLGSSANNTHIFSGFGGSSMW
ncbi:uncharacterized protein CANTADRAFT_5720 [Suhomyces tanzawaensis NRRL Y-17324]|uniref:Uncharacterized protein n=1 Tax=Suhomyces tanzawaensis NRRL Y-17324 TaxID=984487 RepID=A0A1E4SKL0_9ASCO|nr:uncharacterized protein CANTADRAFT_5720 [Suhomyces tanzawaensis NRRL Y-17324]ODV80046.1 hypothetical protein CANTADRAFT_5720 [Suhomyces tanzawaensis NRRL Y-17324]